MIKHYFVDKNLKNLRNLLRLGEAAQKRGSHPGFETQRNVAINQNRCISGSTKKD